jgi:glycosyltransferase involved in cell wall biosynthesis
MRIAIPGHYAGILGGIGTYARLLIDALAANAPSGASVIVPEPPEPEAVGGIASAGGALRRMAWEQVSLPPKVRRADLVHLCDSRPLLLSRRPFVATIHDVSYLERPEWFPAMAAHYKTVMLDALLAARPAALVFDSAYGRDELLRFRPGAARFELRVIRPGVRPPQTDCDGPPSATDPVERSDAYFLTVGAIEPRKNHLTLLRAFRAARAAGLKLRWRVVGPSGHLSDPILRALLADPGVDVLGWVDQRMLERYFREAVFLVAPSILEGFGFSPLEAMARGVPVACSRGGVWDETIGDAALRPGAISVGEWTDALLSLASNERLRADLRDRGHAAASLRAWGDSAAACWQLYENVISDGEPARLGERQQLG